MCSGHKKDKENKTKKTDGRSATGQDSYSSTSHSFFLLIYSECTKKIFEVFLLIEETRRWDWLKIIVGGVVKITRPL